MKLALIFLVLSCTIVFAFSDPEENNAQEAEDENEIMIEEDLPETDEHEKAGADPTVKGAYYPRKVPRRQAFAIRMNGIMRFGRRLCGLGSGLGCHGYGKGSTSTAATVRLSGVMVPMRRGLGLGLDLGRELELALRRRHTHKGNK
eukprot:Seg594.4 transcript_id=Seg594.4/GoldUCD/mRNA.D3Y31 product="hypothetical protein" protein_id=Seg594.4/GoldUCD/D3Y31